MSFSYQWDRCDAGGAACQSVAGSGGSTYLIGTADVGSSVRVAVTASNGTASAPATSAAAGPVAAPSSDPVVVAVGDISCPAGDGTHSCQQGATEAIAKKQNPNAVFVLGDNQYESGSLSEYEGAGAYGSTWGFFNPIVHPVPGNHDYGTAAAAGYFGYFGASVANPDGTNGYYSLNLGNWHVIALNSNCSDQSGCADALAGGTTSAQTAWLQSDLAAERAANPSACVLAMWHHPLFSAGWTLGAPGVAPLWNALYAAHADVVLNGHDHLYERFAQEDPSGDQTAGGIREFVVGTGGEQLNPLSATPPTLEASDARDFGVLVLTLHPSSYTWKFVTIGGTTVDSGTSACHGAGAGAAIAGPTRHPVPTVLARLSERPLLFEVSPLRATLQSVRRRGLRVAVLASRAVDVTVTAWLRERHGLTRIGTFHETESQITQPHSMIRLRFHGRRLAGMKAATLVMRFAAEDGAGHRRSVTQTMRLR